MSPLQASDVVLSETAQLVLHYFIKCASDQDPSESSLDLVPRKLQVQYRLFPHLFVDSQEITNAVSELHQAGLLGGNAPQYDPRLVERIRHNAHDYIRLNYFHIVERIPLGQIWEVVQSAESDENGQRLIETLEFREYADIRQAVAISRQYVTALTELGREHTSEKRRLIDLLATQCGLESHKKPPRQRDGELFQCWYSATSFVPNREFSVAFVVLNTEADCGAQLVAVRRLVSTDATANLSFVILGHPNGFKRRLKEQLENTRGVVLDESDLKSIALSRTPQQAMRECVIPQLPPSTVSPFIYRGPVTGDSFFGRDDELQRILDAKRGNYCILGPRKIGKTSLLLTLEEKVKHQGSLSGTVAVFVDATPNRQMDWFQKNLVQETKRYTDIPWIEPGDHFFEELSLALKQSGRKYLFLIDEIDNLLADKKVFLLEEFVRSLYNEGYARFVLSGYRTLHDRMTSRSSYLYNLLEPVVLGPLQEAEAKSLVMRQMEKIFVSFENDRVVDTILNLGSTFASYLQCMCHLLLQKLDQDRSKRDISQADVVAVYESEEFAREIAGSIKEYSEREFGILERLIVYWAAEQPGDQHTEKEILAGLDRIVYSARFSDVRAALNYLTASYIFGKKNDKYYYRVSLLKTKMRQIEPDMEFVISNLAKEYRSDDRDE